MNTKRLRRRGLLMIAPYIVLWAVANFVLGGIWPWLLLAAWVGYCLGHMLGYTAGMGDHERIVKAAGKRGVEKAFVQVMSEKEEAAPWN